MAVTVIKDPTPDQIPSLEPHGVPTGDEIRHHRAQLFRQYESSEAADAAGTINLTQRTATPDPPREMLESVLVQTPVGEIEFGPPTGISLTLRIAVLMGEENPNRHMTATLRTLMCVRKIDGQPVSPVTNMVEAQYLANLLTDPVIDFLFGLYVENWPPPKAGDLQVLAKNKRLG